ncbi:hypothetical protein V2J09_021404 [Rumex salicifolius]
MVKVASVTILIDSSSHAFGGSYEMKFSSMESGYYAPHGDPCVPPLVGADRASFYGSSSAGWEGTEKSRRH